MVHVVEGKTHPGHKNNVGADGSYTRQPTVFRNVIQPGGEFEPESGRYRLYVSAACGWSHRVMLMRAVMKLEEVIPMTIVHPKRHDDQGWHFQQDVNPDGTLVEGADPRFPECGPDPELGATYLHQIYTTADPNYTGNVTVPVLFDTKTKRIVSNESEVIMRNLNEAFRVLSIAQPSMYPAELQSQIDETNDLVYAGLSNGVYRAGFAKTQELYEAECKKVFDTLDVLEKRLDTSRYLCGPAVSEADLRLFVTLARFDAVYYGHFKCNIRRIAWYPNLSNYLRDVYQLPGIRDTVYLKQYVTHYYWSHESLNPKRRIPKGGLPNLELPHNRTRFEQRGVALLGASDSALHSSGAVRGEFVRPDSKHRNWISAAGNSEFPVEAGRYHLYIANNCPWCHRVVLGRAMLGLQDAISMDVLRYRRDPERGWVFDETVEGCGPDTAAGGIQAIRDLYEREGSTEKSVPVLFDKKLQKIVNNESSEILRMMETEFGALSKNKIDLYPVALQGEIDQLNAWIYQEINNGAYKAGFSSTQEAYEKAYDVFFNAIDKLEFILKDRPFLTGSKVTEADVRLFPTIIRFDHCYYTRFWLNKKMVRECPHLQSWLERMWTLSGVAEGTNLTHVKAGYFGRTGNNVVPLGPDLGPDWGFAEGAADALVLQ